LRYFIIILALFFIGCNNTNSHSEKKEVKNNKTITKKVVRPIKTISTTEIAKFPTLVFKEKNGKISYETNTTNILVFTDDSKMSNAQIKELNKSKRNFYIIKSIKLLNYFDIKKFPTLIVLEKNSSKKYEGFVPNEVLQYELKD